MWRRTLPLAMLLFVPAAAAQPRPGPSGPSGSVPVEVPHGIDGAAMDRGVAPGDDFFAFANGAWLKKTEIPADRPSWSSGAELGEKTVGRLRTILTKAGGASAGSEERKVGDFYATVADEEAIEARGIAPLAPALQRIDGVKDRTALATLLGQELRADVDPLNNAEFHTDRLLGLWVAPNLNAPERYVPYLLQGGLDLPDRDFYLDKSPRMAAIRKQYRAHVAAIFKLAGMSTPDARAARVVALETKMARVHATREASLDVRKANNPWPRAEFATRAAGLDWNAFFRAASLDSVETIVVWQPAAVTGLAALVGKEPLPAWKDWLAFHTIERHADVLPRAFVNEHFAFHAHTLQGTPELAERWKRAVAQTSAALAEPVGHLYVTEHFPAASKAKLQQMIKLIVEAFRARIDRLDWMDAKTKARAKEKLGTLYVGVGYPDRWTDVTALEVVRGDAVGNADRTELFQLGRSLAKLGKPVDNTEWCMSPQTVNAVNLPLQNALNFPAAILQPPYFDPEAPDAVNFGAIGAVIGHEISHSFDDQGAQFDAHGKLTDWWTAGDRAHFEASGARLAAQYDGYRPFPDLHLNGKLTLSENIADLAGLEAAHDALLASSGGARTAPGGMSVDQLFFLAYAQSWRGKARDAALRQQIITDGHSPRQYRVATVRNLDAWVEAFGVQPGMKLYLAPAERVHVW